MAAGRMTTRLKSCRRLMAVNRPCKTKKVKCGEEKPGCLNCERQGEPCDYSIRLNWEGRTKRKTNELTPEPGQNESVSISTAIGMDLFPPSLGTTLSTGDLKLDSSSPVKDGQPFQEEAADAIDESQLAHQSGCLQNADAPNSFSTMRPLLYQPLPSYSQQQNYRDGYSAAQLQRFRGTSASYPEIGPEQDAVLSKYDASETTSQIPDEWPLSGELPPLNRHYLRQTTPETFGVDLLPMLREEPASKRQRIEHPLDVPSDNKVDMTVRKSPAVAHVGNMPTPPTSSSTPSATSTTFRLSNAPSSVRSTQFAARRPSPANIHTCNDPRRLSVNSLLSSPTALESSNQMVPHGIDGGFPDLDIPRNEDQNVLEGVTPVSTFGSFAELIIGASEAQAGFGFGLYSGDSAHSKKGYYASPVAVTIPRSLEPLPPVLLECQMNLLYFHHFLNHTARILVPHDCSENPFRIILPQSRSPDCGRLLI